MATGLASVCVQIDDPTNVKSGQDTGVDNLYKVEGPGLIAQGDVTDVRLDIWTFRRLDVWTF